MRPRAGEVLHFSEDPTIETFEPHLAVTAQQPEAYVWAVDSARAPDYWFPRGCPRVLAWAGPRTTDADRERLLGAGAGERVHAVELGWLRTMATTTLYAYRLPAQPFAAFPGQASHALVSTVPVRPLAPPEPVGDLFALHADAGIPLRALPGLWDFWDDVTTSTLEFSGIRLRNARPRA